MWQNYLEHRSTVPGKFVYSFIQRPRVGLSVGEPAFCQRNVERLKWIATVGLPV